MRELPSSIDQVTPQWLGAFLSQRYPGTTVEQLRLFDRSDGTATRVGLEARYGAGADPELPSRLFLKSLLIPQIAPTSLFLCEVEFYRTMRPELSIETPRIFGSELDPQSGRFVVLMEDITARGARFGIATRPCTAREAAAVLESCAGLHAQYWQSPRLNSEFGWLETHLVGANADYFRNDCPALLLQEYRISPYKTEIFDPSGFYTPERLWKALWKLQEINEADVPTVLHGDVHVGNTYIVADGGGGLLDWQLMRKGSWAHDVTYLIVTGLTPEERRRHEAALIRGYLELLERRGIATPDWDTAWLRHRQNVVWGILMWLLTPTPLYDQERLEILLQRHRAAAEDLDAFAALGCD